MQSIDVFVQFALTMAVAAASGVLAYVALSNLARRPALQQLLVWQRSFAAGWADRILCILVLAFVLVFGALALLRYYSFHTGYLDVYTAWDLGQYHQIVWNSLHGRLFENTYIPDARTFLGKSFAPILLAFVPLYAIWSDAAVLLIVQTIGLALGALPIYWYARQQLGRPLALAVGLTYLLSPGLQFIGLAEFHEVALTAPALAYATFFLMRRRYEGFVVCLGLALLMKEEIAFVVVLFGLFIAIVQRRVWAGAALASAGALWGFFVLTYLIPFFRGAEYGPGFYYFGQGAIAGGGNRYAYLGNSLSEIVVNLLTHPYILLQQLLIPAKLEYTLHLLVPLAFIPLVGIEVAMLALPTYSYSILSQYGLQYSIQTSYFSPLLPFLFFAAVVGLKRLLRLASVQPLAGRFTVSDPVAFKGALLALVLTASGLSYWFQSPGPLGGKFQPERYALDAHAALGQQLARPIPSDATVVAQNELLAVLSGRQRVYEVPIPDYREVDYLVADRTRQWYGVHQGFWESDLATGYFEIVKQEDGYLVARRRSPAVRLEIRYGEAMTLDGYTIVPSDRLVGGQVLRPAIEWRAQSETNARYVTVMELADARGNVWALDAREPLDGHSPTSQWRKGQIIGDQFKLALPSTMPPGDYQLRLGVKNHEQDEMLPAADAQGRALGEQPALATLRVEKDHTSLTASQVPIEQPLYVNMGEIRFLGSTPVGGVVRAEAPLRVGLYWRALGRPQGDYVVAVQLRDASERVSYEEAARPAGGAYPTTEWQAGEVLLDWHALTLPASVIPGEYQVWVILREAAGSRVLGETGIGSIVISRH